MRTRLKLGRLVEGWEFLWKLHERYEFCETGGLGWGFCSFFLWWYKELLGEGEEPCLLIRTHLLNIHLRVHLPRGHRCTSTFKFNQSKYVVTRWITLVPDSSKGNGIVFRLFSGSVWSCRLGCHPARHDKMNEVQVRVFCTERVPLQWENEAEIVTSSL